MAFLLGFALVWYIWWLAIASLVAMVVTVVSRAYADDIHYILPASEVERMEDERFQNLAVAGHPPSPFQGPEP
jgi:cytochrome o ubiquinol oxidase subunit 1